MPRENREPVTRFAPSPTGALHLGNARTFLINWLLARKHGWRIAFRIEDLDGPRIKAGADRQIVDDLQWLTFDWDFEQPRQSTSAALYRATVEQLLQSGHAYPCVCSRREVEQAASAPHAEDGSAVYPGTCRGKYGSIDEARSAGGREPAVRFRLSDEPIKFVDGFAGSTRFENPARQLGDFVIQKSDGTAAYQLAVVVDDYGARVSEVVRGDDLIDSTPRQTAIYRALGWGASIPTYTHLPLVVGPDGKRLAKRHGDTRISFYRDAGVPGARVLSLLARWCGMVGEFTSAAEMLQHFDLARLARKPVVFTANDDAFLRGSA